MKTGTSVKIKFGIHKDKTGKTMAKKAKDGFVNVKVSAKETIEVHKSTLEVVK